jgi:hypothetical protein
MIDNCDSQRRRLRLGQSNGCKPLTRGAKSEVAVSGGGVPGGGACDRKNDQRKTLNGSTKAMQQRSLNETRCIAGLMYRRADVSQG